MSSTDLRRNNSGCADPTAYNAIMNVTEEEVRFRNMLHTVRYICKLAGFQIEGRITFVDKRTGRIWR